MPTTSWGLTFDCENAPAMARFWIVALGYVDKPPPEGWDTWEDWLRHAAAREEPERAVTVLEDRLAEFLGATLPTVPPQPARDDWPARRTWDTDWQRRLFEAKYLRRKVKVWFDPSKQ